MKKTSAAVCRTLLIISLIMISFLCDVCVLGGSQYHLAVAGGCAVSRSIVNEDCAPTSYREVVLTASKFVSQSAPQSPQSSPRKTRDAIENAQALHKFFQTLALVQSGQRIDPVRIMHFGDSHVAADVLTREIRERFQTEFGDGGAGFIVPRNPMATKRHGISSGFTEGWVIEGIGGKYSADALYGPAGINLATSDPGERAWLEASGNHFEVYFARQPNGGKVEITIDGADALEEPLLLTSRVTKLDSIAIDLPDDAPHRLEVRTLSPGRVRLLGMVAEHLSGGVSYDVFGINGAKASRILSWNQPALTAAIKARDPNLIILAYGTNELTDGTCTSAAYQSLLTEILQLFHSAAPTASILVFGPPDRSDLPLTARLQELVSAERRTALANKAAFWSGFDAMGGAGSMQKWVRLGLAQPDRVHLTLAGYAKLADMFYDDLLRVRD
jgi:lysophospholipase L1-like esterase